MTATTTGALALRAGPAVYARHLTRTPSSPPPLSDIPPPADA